MSKLFYSYTFLGTLTIYYINISRILNSPGVERTEPTNSKQKVDSSEENKDDNESEKSLKTKGLEIEEANTRFSLQK